jgi:hypothetical protein
MSFRKVILSSLVPATETIIGVLKNNKDVVVIVLTSAQLNSHASQLKLQKQKRLCQNCRWQVGASYGLQFQPKL